MMNIMKAMKPLFYVLYFFTVLQSNVWADSEANSRWYIGTGFGQGEVEVVGHDRKGLVNETLTGAGYSVNNASGSEHDGTDTWKLFSGYQFNQYWAAEFSFQELGNTDGSFTVNVDGGDTLQGGLSSDYRASTLSLLGFWPLADDIRLLGRVGVHYWQHEFKMRGAVDISDTDSGIDYAYGFGLDYQIFQPVRLRVEWERLNGIEDEEGIDIKSLSLIYSF